MKDLHNVLHAVPGVVPAAAKTAAVTGSGVDLLGYQGAEIFVNVGIRTDSTFVSVLKECATAAGTYTTVADADILGTQPTISGVNSTVYSFGYKGSKRFIKPTFTFTAGGASAGAFIDVIVVKGFKRHETGG